MYYTIFVLAILTYHILKHAIVPKSPIIYPGIKNIIYSPLAQPVIPVINTIITVVN